MKCRQRLHSQMTCFEGEIIIPALDEYVQHEVDFDFRYKVLISPINLVKKYGRNCEKIFRLLFTLHQVGGRSKTGCNYVTMWYARYANLQKYCVISDELADTEYTPKMVLAKLTEAGCTESRRVKIGAEPEVIDGQALLDYKRLVTYFRQLEREEQQQHDGTYWS